MIDAVSDLRPRRKNPEVLAPAGNLRTVKTAIDFGADAVYCGGKEFGMRSAPKNLTLDDFAEAVSYAHARDARIYVTCNVLPRNDEVEQMNAYIGQLADIGVDAIIVSDVGVLMSAKSIAPSLDVHISTQAGVTNYQAANALHQLGASRVVLARELDLDSVRQIRAHTAPELEIEAFVHGSMCMAFSGRCLISQHLTGRDGNHGDCAQPCRWKYHVVEEKRPGEFFPVEVTDQGTFLFSSHDMNMLAHIDDLLDAGVTSLKIEGRAKSAHYVAAMANAYACAVDAYLVQRGFEDQDGNQLHPFCDLVVRAPGFTLDDATTMQHICNTSGLGYRPAVELSAGCAMSAVPGELCCVPPKVVLPQWLLEEPYKVTHRHYSTGFYYPRTPAGEDITTGGYINDWQIVGEVLDYADGRVYLISRNKIVPGQHLEVLTPKSAPLVLQLPAEGILDEDDLPVALINHPAHLFSFPCAVPIRSGAIIRSPKLNRIEGKLPQN